MNSRHVHDGQPEVYLGLLNLGMCVVSVMSNAKCKQCFAHTLAG
jgi:hypothetical protein